MYNRESYYRARTRSRPRSKEPRPDALTVSITARIAACIVLLLMAWGVGKLDPVHRQSFRDSYHSLTGEEQIGWISEGTNSFAAAFDGYLQSISGWMDKVVYHLTGREAELVEEAPEQEEVYQFDYDYLKESSFANGMGGENPAEPVYDDKDVTRLYAPTGSVLSPVYSTAKLGPPVAGRVTSQFAWREHPVTGAADFHTGMDIAAEEGRAILSVLPGRVSEVGWSDIYGNYIVLNHADNFKTSYSHCSEILAEEGMMVKKGERIAKVGQTGMVTGPHLHFSVIVDDNFTDPYWTLGNNIRTVGS